MYFCRQKNYIIADKMNCRRHISIILAMLLSLFLGVQDASGQRNNARRLHSPPHNRETKTGTRWWWFGSAVDSVNLAYNMKQYAECGIGTVEITPIYGVKGNERNNIEFLSDRWMDMFRLTKRLAKENNITVEMSTGTGWPFGGPMVPLEESACKAVFVERFLSYDDAQELDIMPEEKDRKNTSLLIAMAYPMPVVANLKDNADALNDRMPFNVTSFIHNGKLTWTPPFLHDGPSVQWTVVALYLKRGIMKVKRPAPGGEGWVIDHFDSTAVAHYLNHISDRFIATNTPFPDVFFNDSYEVAEGDWTPTLLKEFEKRRGYRLEDHFLQLLNSQPDVLSDYRETLAELLLENFTRQWTAWAHSHGALTRNQAHGSPANLIDCYAAVDIPEIEGFGLSDFGIRGLRTDSGMTRKNDSDLSMLKYAPSAAHVSGKTLCSSETFTWLTEHFRTSLSQLKPDLDLMFCAGVNHIFTHGTAYSPQEATWPGWKFYASIDMSPTNSIWRDAPFFMQYVDNCQSFLQWGNPDNDFLVLLPVRDMWRKDTKRLLMQFSIHQMNDLAPEFIHTILDIDKAGFDCDYISESLLLSTTFRGGKLQTKAGTTYKGLIIPQQNTNLSPAVREHIAHLKAKGAHIIYGVNTEAMSRCATPEAMKTELGLNIVRRRNNFGYHYFIANLTPNDVDTCVSLAVDYKYAVWTDPLTGEEYNAELVSSKGKCNRLNSSPLVKVHLRSGESRLLRVQKDSFYALNGALLEGKRTAFTMQKGWFLSFKECVPDMEDKSFRIDTLRTWDGIDSLTAQLMGTGVYETRLILNENDVSDDANWLLELGDVRESARVYINDEFAGCAWSVPFKVAFKGLLHSGANKIRIEVTNLPANRIAQMDRDGIEWRIMEDINIVDIHYKKTTYADWKPMPSGLNGPVTLYRLF